LRGRGHDAGFYRRTRQGPATNVVRDLVFYVYSGDVLLSQGDSPQVPSALAGLTSVFGMGTGVTPPLWPPETLLNLRMAAARDGRPL
jgi:hypothetical protein